MTLASCSKHLTHAPGCPACEAAEQARRSRKDASRQAREARRAARRQNQLIAEQTAAQEENNLRLAEQTALQEENNRLLARQNALLEQQAADEAAFRWSMWLQTPDGRILKEWAGRRVAVAKAMEEALKNWRGAWEPLVSATEREARRDTSPSAGEPPPTGRNLSYIWFYIGPPLLIAWVVAQFYIDLAVKWRLLATLILVIGWFILFMVLPDGGYEARRRYDEEQEADFERRLEQRTTELLTVRYGFDPRGTSPWTGGLSTADVERFTQSQLERAASAYRLPADMSIPTLNLRAWRAPMPAGARDALRRLAPWAASAPEEPRALPAGSPAGQTDTRPRGARSRGRALHMIEMMAIYEAAWVRAWQGWEGDGGLGFDPFSSAPWEGVARAAVLEDALEAGGDPALPDLVLRDPDERWPEAARELIVRIIDDGDLPAAPPPSSPEC